jgi:hypothetical protein
MNELTNLGLFATRVEVGDRVAMKAKPTLTGTVARLSRNGVCEVEWDSHGVSPTPSRCLDVLLKHGTCEACGGSGVVRVHAPEDYGVSFESDECRDCYGTGRELPANAIHVDVCPGCEEPATWHGLDAPQHCQCGFDREQYVPAVYVPFLEQSST